MHNLVSNGLAQLQTALLINHLRDVSNFQFEDLRMFGKSGWKVASASGNSGHIRSALSAKRFDKGDFTASASDMLLAMPVSNSGSLFALYTAGACRIAVCYMQLYR